MIRLREVFATHDHDQALAWFYELMHDEFYPVDVEFVQTAERRVDHCCYAIAVDFSIYERDADSVKGKGFIALSASGREIGQF